MLFLIGDDADGPSADARIAAKQRLAVFGAVFLKLASVHDTSNYLAHVVLPGRITGKDAVDFLGGIKRVLRLYMAEGRGIRRAHLVRQRANARDAGVIVRLSKIHRAADLCVHFRATQFLRGGFLPDGGLHQRRPGKKQSRAFGHQDVVAHHRKIRAPRHAHAHDGSNLRNALGAHHRVVAKHPAKVVGIGKNIFLQRKKYSGGIDEINCGNAILDGDILRANHFLRGHRKERAGFHRRIVGDNHECPAANFRQARDGARARGAAPLLIHLERCVNSQFEKLPSGIDQLGDALARSQAALFVLRLNCFGAPALANLFLFILDLGEKIDDAARVLFEVGRFAICGSFQDGSGHSIASRKVDRSPMLMGNKRCQPRLTVYEVCSSFCESLSGSHFRQKHQATAACRADEKQSGRV